MLERLLRRLRRREVVEHIPLDIFFERPEPQRRGRRRRLRVYWVQSVSIPEDYVVISLDHSEFLRFARKEKLEPIFRVKNTLVAFRKGVLFVAKLRESG